MGTCYLFLALCKFCESILDYVANIEKAPDKAVRKEAFSGEMFAAFDVLFNVWLNTKEPKVRQYKAYVI